MLIIQSFYISERQYPHSAHQNLDNSTDFILQKKQWSRNEKQAFFFFYPPCTVCYFHASLLAHNEAKSMREADGVKNAILIYVGEWNRCGYDFVIMQLTEREEAKG